MTQRACQEIRDKLVDYADGELSGPQAQTVREHLAVCPACRDLIRGLERSLDLAQTIWLDNLQSGTERVCEKWHGHPAREMSWHRRPANAAWAGRPCHENATSHAPSEVSPVRRHPSVGQWGWYLGAAAGVLIVVGLLALTLLQPPAQTPAYAELERQATRCAAAARLLVATEILAGCEGTESLVARQREYILNHYPDTPAAAKLRAAAPLILGDES